MSEIENFKAQFRRGNLFNHVLLGTSMILEIKNNGISYCNPDNWQNAYMDGNDNLHRIEVLPLTEQWLLKLGFTKPKHSNDFYDYPKNYSIEFWKKESSLVIWPEDIHGGSVMDRIDIPCEYVHQLQNLIFAITGEELTTSPTSTKPELPK